jgi:hypothetical protein
MTMFVFPSTGKAIGWAPDDNPEWEYHEDWDEWRPVVNGNLAVLLIETEKEEITAPEGK